MPDSTLTSSEITEFRKDFADFRARDFADLRVKVTEGFGRIDRLEDRIVVVEKEQQKKATGITTWVGIVATGGGGGIVVWLLDHLVKGAQR